MGIHELAHQLLRDAGQPVDMNLRKVEDAFDLAWTRSGVAATLMDIHPHQQYWRDEIDNVIKGRGLRTVAEYESIQRRGRHFALADTHKIAVWTLFEHYNRELVRADLDDSNDVLARALDLVSQQPPDPGWTAVLVDEVQDLPLLAVKLCAALGGTSTDGLFLAGDGQQALYSGGFTLAEAGVSVLGRATILTINYRNTPNIARSSFEIAGNREYYDLDHTAQPGHRNLTLARPAGADTVHEHAPNRDRLVLPLIRALLSDYDAGTSPGEMAVLTHTNRDANFFRDVLTGRGFDTTDLNDWDGEPDNTIKTGTMNRAKGLEFSAVYLITKPIPPANAHGRYRTPWDTNAINREFVGRSRARDRLWIGTITPRTTPGVGGLSRW